MSSTDEGYAAAAAQIEAWAEQGRAQLRRAQALEQVTRTTTASAWSPAHDVRATVDGAGLLRDLELTDKALDASALQLSATITATVRTALGRLPDRLEAAAEEATGADPMARSMVAHSRATVAEALLAQPPV
ncbi:YbaB/EbfC family nucleoid-associated protein [Cellulomonas sp. Marseille-Q8402]